MKTHELCTKCYKHHNKTISKYCDFCQDLKFSEQIFCEIHRDNSSDESDLICKAFKPNLTIANNQTSAENPPPEAEKELISHDIGMSAKVRWLDKKLEGRTSNSQEAPDDDEVIHELKYHFCILTRDREKLFPFPQRTHMNIAGMVSESSIGVGLPMQCLAVGEDHIHVFVRGNPDYSLNDIAYAIIENVERQLDKHAGNRSATQIFLRDYFAETIGGLFV